MIKVARARALLLTLLLMMAWAETGAGRPGTAARLSPLSATGTVIRGVEPATALVRCTAGGGFEDSTGMEAELVATGGIQLVGQSHRLWRHNVEEDTWEVAGVVTPGDSFTVSAKVTAYWGPAAKEVVEWTASGIWSSAGDVLAQGRLKRQHRLVNGKWYRIGGPVLVPTDSAEVCTEEDIVSHVTIGNSVAIQDSALAAMLQGESVIDCWVCVDASGTVTDVSRVDNTPLSETARAMLVARIGSLWSFVAALGPHGPVSDCIRCQVPVEPEE